MGRATTAVILARGLGTRMRAKGDGAALSAEQAAAAARGEKGMMPLGGRPLLDFVLHELADGGVTRVVFVVAPGASSVRDHYTQHPPRRISVSFAVQAEARGTADALLAAREAVGAEPFLMLNADNLYSSHAVASLVELDGPGLVAYEAAALVRESGIPAERVMQFALLDLAPDGTVRAIAEKPGADHPLAKAPERWVSMNLWRFDTSIFGDCAAVKPSPRGELELSDAVRGAIARGVRFTAVRVREAVLDLSRRDDIAGLASRLAGRTPSP